MQRHPTAKSSEAPPVDSDAPSAVGGTPVQSETVDGLAELRKLLVGDEQAEIAELKARLQQQRIDAAKVAKMLPDAVATSTSSDERLAAALAPTIGTAVQTSIKRDPQGLVDAISPIMGPAIRRSIRQAISSMLQSLNQTLEHSVSARGLGWRWEAFRTGKPFAEVVMLHTLVYEVDQVYLIHRQTGLLLNHAAHHGEETQDADLISAMLTAIQDFVRDSFGDGAGTATRDEHDLEIIQVGEQTVWVEEGAQAVIACVIRGHAPRALRTQVIETLENIHIQRREELASFDGDTTPFEACHGDLASCLDAQYQPKSGGSNTKAMVAIGAVAAAMVLGIGAWMYLSISERRAWEASVQRLRDEPGLVVTETGRRDGKYHVAGLRDPLANDPLELLRESLGARFDSTEYSLDFKPYFSAEPEMIELRRTAEESQ